jgi:hypothetical protein
MPDAELIALMVLAAAEGARQVLADAGLDGAEAALGIRDLRALLASIRFVRRTALQTTVRLITTGVQTEIEGCHP